MMTWKEYAQTASVRQYAMIFGSFIATILYVWTIFLIQHFLDGKVYTQEQFYDLTKFQLQVIAYCAYIAGGSFVLFVCALTLTKFSAVTKAGSLSVDQDEDKAVATVTTKTTVEQTP